MTDVDSTKASDTALNAKVEQALNTALDDTVADSVKQTKEAIVQYMEQHTEKKRIRRTLCLDGEYVHLKMSGDHVEELEISGVTICNMPLATLKNIVTDLVEMMEVV